jgi:hypothetical protein
MVQNDLVHFRHSICAMCGAQNGESWETDRKRVTTLRVVPRHQDWPETWIICDECELGLDELVPI